MKYIVTGGAGFIGSHLVEELVRQQHEVVIIDDLSSGTLENITPLLSQSPVTFVQGSITDLSLLKKYFSDADGVFHEAAIASVPRSIAYPHDSHDVNLTGTLTVLIAARDCAVNNVVFASSAAIYGNNPVLPKRESMIPDPLSPYAVTKIGGENYCSVFSRLYGMHCSSLRYFNVYGPRQNPDSPYSGVITKFITSILHNQPIIIFGDGLQTRDFVYIKDVVRGNISAMEKGISGEYNIACGMQNNLLELIQIITDITDQSVQTIFKPSLTGDVRDSVADITHVKEIFGYRPEYTLRRGLEETINWFRSR